MAALNQEEIIRMKADSLEARLQSKKLLENSRRIVQEYRQIVEHSRRLIDYSFNLKMRAAEQSRRMP